MNTARPVVAALLLAGCAGAAPPIKTVIQAKADEPAQCPAPPSEPRVEALPRLAVVAPAMDRELREMIAAQFKVDVSQVTDAADIYCDLKADSLEAVELVMAFEEAYSLQIPDDHASAARRVGDIVRYVAARQAEPGGGVRG